MKLPYEIGQASQEVQNHYIKMVNAGQTEKWAEMCALQQAPGTTGLDRSFFEGRQDGNWMDQLPKRQAKWMLKAAKESGVNVSGKYYVGGIADKRGASDPEAWVSSLDDIKRVAKKRNINLSGAVQYQGFEEAPLSRGLNPKIAKELAKKEIAQEPKLSMRDALERVNKKHVPHWKAKKT